MTHRTKLRLDTGIHATPDEFMRGAVFNILLVVASGFLASLLFPPWEIWWFGWLYLVPLLVALRRTSEVRSAGWLMLLFALVFHAFTLKWLMSIFSGMSLGVYLLMSLPMVLFGLGYRVVGKSGKWLGILALTPVLWVAADWLRCEGWYFQFSWAQLGFAFASCRRGGVLYPYIGVYGVTFLLVLVNAIIAEILLSRATWAKRLGWLAITAMPVIALSLYLNTPIGIPVLPEEQGKNAFRACLVQDESGAPETLAALTRTAKDFHPNLIVWPEYAIADYPLSKPAVFAELTELAQEMNCTLILGCKEHVPEGTRVDWLRRRGMLYMEGELFANSALVISPTGKLLGTYHKTHPIQLFSDGVPGRAFPTFPTPVGRVGIGICYDFDFASTAWRLVHNGAELLVVPTYDSLEWPAIQHYQHSLMAQTRAAEVNRWVVRTTSSGVSQVINPRGQVVGRIETGASVRTLAFAAPLQGTTLYSRLLYRLPHVCAILAALWALYALITSWQRRRKSALAAQEPTTA